MRFRIAENSSGNSSCWFELHHGFDRNPSGKLIEACKAGVSEGLRHIFIAELEGSAAGVRGGIGKVIQSKRKISGEREDDEPLADNQRHVAYAYKLDEDCQNRRVSDAHAGQR